MLSFYPSLRCVPCPAWLLATATLFSLAAGDVNGQSPPVANAGPLGVFEFEKGFLAYDHSETFTQLSAVNNRGGVIGIREVSDKTGMIFSQKHFYQPARGELVDLPLLEGFTNVEAEALSDDGKVVGFASRPIGSKDGSLIGIVWEAATGKVTRLEPLPGDLVSHAQDISSDGKRISGYSTGFDPQRLRPCVWQRDKASGWAATELSSIEAFNPYLMSASAVISPDGKRVAACITEEFLPGGHVDSSLYVWDASDDGWKRRKVSSDQLHLRDINNEGVIVGAISKQSVRLACSVTLAGELTEYDLLDGDELSEAQGINGAGLVVGISNDPHGPEGGPAAFQVREGKSLPIAMPKGTEYSTATGVNEAGDIVGMADIELPDVQVKNEQTGELEPLVKAVGYLKAASK